MHHRIIFIATLPLFVLLPSNAFAETINKDYQVEIKQSYIRQYDSKTYYASLSPLDTPAIIINEGDIFKGTITFADNTAVNMLSGSSISARLLFRNPSNGTVEAMSYTTSITTSLLDIDGREVGQSTYSSSDNEHYVNIYPDSIQNYPSTATKPITGLNFKIQFSNVRKSGRKETVSLQLRHMTVGMFTGMTSAVPEPSSWAMMLFGFAMIGAASRYRRRRTTAIYA